MVIHGIKLNPVGFTGPVLMLMALLFYLEKSMKKTRIFLVRNCYEILTKCKIKSLDMV